MTEASSQSTDLPEPDLAGRSLGDYHLLRRLGRGGMAEVYLSHQESLDRPVAVKILKQSLSSDSTYVRRFHHEAKAAANLVQANIVQIYEVGESDGIHFIAQEYVKGQNVKQYLHRHGAVDLFLAVNILRQVTSALIKAAEHGVIHRDIKPENIMLSSNGEVKVADFGLARVMRQEKTDLTQVGVTMGTPLYMSPEQVEGQSVDPRSDIYSLGVTVYEMLVGKPPFEGDTALAVAIKHLKQEPIALEVARPDIPAEFCDIVRKMMAKRPRDRFQSPADLLRELRKLQIEESDEAWEETLRQLSVSASLSNPMSLSQGTRRLDDLLRREKVRAPSKTVIALVGVVLVMVAAAIGATAAWLNPPRDLLAVESSERDAVEQMETVQEQYRLAYQLRTEWAWRAVARYFDPTANNRNLYYARLAQVRLGELYLRQERNVEALEIFQQLAGAEEGAREFRMLGFAGAAIAHMRLGDETQARVAMRQFDAQVEFSSQPWRSALAGNEFLRDLVAELRDDLNWEVDVVGDPPVVDSS